jgi:hypothetical protein
VTTGTPPGAGASGETLGRYRLEAPLGRGGMAEVWRAQDTALGRPVAVKVILPALAADSSFVERFLREARLVAALDHPNVVPVWDVGETLTDGQRRPYLVMPLLDGGSLAGRLDGRPWPLAAALPLLQQVAAALDHAHGRGILHRDVKPANVLLARDGRVWLSDFGIAKSTAASSQLTVTGAVVGTPVYMAPEVARGGAATPASDRYALAVLAYELLTGRPPFVGENALALLHQHVTEVAPPATSWAPGLPPRVDEVFAAALAKDPAARPSSARSLVASLAEAGPEAGFGGRAEVDLGGAWGSAGLPLFATPTASLGSTLLEPDTRAAARSREATALAERSAAPTLTMGSTAEETVAMRSPPLAPLAQSWRRAGLAAIGVCLVAVGIFVMRSGGEPPGPPAAAGAAPPTVAAGAGGPSLTDGAPGERATNGAAAAPAGPSPEVGGAGGSTSSAQPIVEAQPAEPERRAEDATTGQFEAASATPGPGLAAIRPGGVREQTPRLGEGGPRGAVALARPPLAGGERAEVLALRGYHRRPNAADYAAVRVQAAGGGMPAERAVAAVSALAAAGEAYLAGDQATLRRRLAELAASELAPTLPGVLVLELGGWASDPAPPAWALALAVGDPRREAAAGLAAEPAGAGAAHALAVAVLARLDGLRQEARRQAELAHARAPEGPLRAGVAAFLGEEAERSGDAAAALRWFEAALAGAGNAEQRATYALLAVRPAQRLRRPDLVRRLLATACEGQSALACQMLAEGSRRLPGQRADRPGG